VQHANAGESARSLEPFQALGDSST